MRFGVSFYAGYGIDNLTYLRAAQASGVQWFFTSLHITELDPQALAADLADTIRQLGSQARVVADLSPRTLQALGASPQDLGPLARLGLSGLRVDYGYSLAELATMADNPYNLTLVLNASTVDPHLVQGLLPAARVEFWHNFYPRPETGLGWEWMIARSRSLREMGYRVGAFLPWLPGARPPLGEGLPTVERHRRIPTRRAAGELVSCQQLDIIILGDPCGDPELLNSLRLAIENEAVTLHMVSEELTVQETAVVFDAIHVTRPDPSAAVLRSATSRSMAAVGGGIEARGGQPRPRYTVTVDNDHYQRYAGELQITLVDLPADARVNVVGHVVAEDWPLVDMIQPGGRFRLVRVSPKSQVPSG